MDKKEVRKCCNYVTGGILLYLLVSFCALILWEIVNMLAIMIRVDNEAEADKMIDVMIARMEQDGGCEIFGVLCGMVILLLFFRSKVSRQEIFSRNNAMTWEKFVQIVCVFMGAQFIFNIMALLLEKGVNLFGYSMMASMESASSASETVSMFLYASILGPVVEELIYRGFVLRSFMKFGKIPAIVFSSLMFGVMHGNLVQIPFACLVGLVLGYVTVEYSIGYSMLLHILNNCIFGDLLQFFVKNFSESTQDIIISVIFVVFFLAAVTIIWKKRKVIKEYLIVNRTQGKFYRYGFTAILFLIFIVVHFAMGISMLEHL